MRLETRTGAYEYSLHICGNTEILESIWRSEYEAAAGEQIDSETNKEACGEYLREFHSRLLDYGLRANRVVTFFGAWDGRHHSSRYYDLVCLDHRDDLEAWLEDENAEREDIENALLEWPAWLESVITLAVETAHDRACDNVRALARSWGEDHAGWRAEEAAELNAE